MGGCATKPTNVDMEKEEKDPAKKSGELGGDPTGESYTPRPSLREIFKEYDEKKDDNSAQEKFHDAEELEEKEEEEPNQKQVLPPLTPSLEQKDETVQEEEQNPKPGLVKESKPETEDKDETGLEQKSVESESNANAAAVNGEEGTGDVGKEKKGSAVLDSGAGEKTA